MNCKDRTKDGLCNRDGIRCPGDTCRHGNDEVDSVFVHLGDGPPRLDIDLSISVAGVEIPLGISSFQHKWEIIWATCERRLSNYNGSHNYCLENNNGEFTLYHCKMGECPMMFPEKSQKIRRGK